MNTIKITTINVIDRIVIFSVPLMIGLIGTMTLISFIPTFAITKEEGLEIVKSIFDVWGILLGFVITAVSILLTANKSELIENLIATNHMQSIIFSYITSSTYLFIAIIYALILIIFQIWGKIVSYIFIGLNIVIVVSVGMSIVFLFRIMHNMNK